MKKNLAYFGISTLLSFLLTLGFAVAVSDIAEMLSSGVWTVWIWFIIIAIVFVLFEGFFVMIGISSHWAKICAGIIAAFVIVNILNSFFPGQYFAEDIGAILMPVLAFVFTIGLIGMGRDFFKALRNPEVGERLAIRDIFRNSGYGRYGAALVKEQAALETEELTRLELINGIEILFVSQIAAELKGFVEGWLEKVQGVNELLQRNGVNNFQVKTILDSLRVAAGMAVEEIKRAEAGEAAAAEGVTAQTEASVEKTEAAAAGTQQLGATAQQQGTWSYRSGIQNTVAIIRGDEQRLQELELYELKIINLLSSAIHEYIGNMRRVEATATTSGAKELSAKKAQNAELIYNLLRKLYNATYKSLHQRAIFLHNMAYFRRDLRGVGQRIVSLGRKEVRAEQQVAEGEARGNVGEARTGLQKGEKATTS